MSNTPMIHSRHRALMIASTVLAVVAAACGSATTSPSVAPASDTPASVAPGGSPAASAGMTGGAVITSVNGQAVGSPDDLTGILSRFHPGDTISVTWVSPSGQRTTSSMHLTAGPPQ